MKTIHEPECVRLKRRGAEHVAKLLAGKSREEQLAYWRERTKDLLAEQENEKKDEAHEKHSV